MAQDAFAFNLEAGATAPWFSPDTPSVSGLINSHRLVAGDQVPGTLFAFLVKIFSLC